MKNRYVLIDDTGEFETFYTGVRDGLGKPCMSPHLENALPFASPGLAVEAANRARSPLFEAMKVGRRPQPVNFKRIN